MMLRIASFYDLAEWTIYRQINSLFIRLVIYVRKDLTKSDDL